MTPQQIIDYCLAKKGAYIDYPFGPDVVVIKVGKTSERSGRIFAQIFKLKDIDTVTLNCDIMTGQFYRDLLPNIVVRGYHCPAVQQPYFNTFPLTDDVPDELIIEMIEHSYKTVLNKLPKYVQKSLKS
ncbi:MmcQ/YjbR family DNA-binding protein [Paludicola sp. MB14-C6]|uniref:MmcQ/YjbR family DNA-binding protein n=1 Tax=Paludihabitans sp. MB14-C6 TaxID=3070656 RepID=UPI0027DD952E|nr:MmcQ/YjbR family DNA-binding protein [Paludicola sp. MB14-C6]WMJ23192.1 MmcQ/YjbR family DNA-binding protein [Paludicola sp. MB14-C6]